MLHEVVSEEVLPLLMYWEQMEIFHNARTFIGCGTTYAANQKISHLTVNLA